MHVEVDRRGTPHGSRTGALLCWSVGLREGLTALAACTWHSPRSFGRHATDQIEEESLVGLLASGPAKP